jgi:hypothetical protein
MGILRFAPRQFGSISEWNSDDILRKSDEGALYIGRYRNPGDAFRTLLEFDLSLLPVGKKYKTAYLQLYIYRNQIPQGTIRASIHPLAEPWDENMLGWNNRPQAAEKPVQTIIIPADWTGYILFDMSALLRGWLDGGIKNHGCMITGDEENDRLVAFASPAYPARDQHPQLLLIEEDSQRDYCLP